MSIRLDPRRLGVLKRLAAEGGVRPGDLVLRWVEERIDGTRGAEAAAPAPDMARQLAGLTARVEALEAAARAAAAPAVQPTPATGSEPASRVRRRSASVSAAPAGERVALHDEMIAVLRERGPMSAAELAGAITERGRYAPPRSGKALDAAMVSQRVSNPTYRSRFTRDAGRIGLAE
jgi:hypothetical protein